MPTIVDESTRECLAIDVARRPDSEDVLDRLAELFVRRGTPAFLRSDNGAELTANAVREWLARLGVQTLYLEPGSPWENGYVESFNGKLRDELLDREIFYTLQEAQVLIERWRQHYNGIRPHSSLGYRPPAPEAIEIGPPGMDSLPLALAPGSNIGSGLPRGAGHAEAGRCRAPVGVRLRRAGARRSAGAALTRHSSAPAHWGGSPT